MIYHVVLHRVINRQTWSLTNTTGLFHPCLVCSCFNGFRKCYQNEQFSLISQPRLDLYSQNEVTQQGISEFESQWRVPVLGIRNEAVTAHASAAAASHTDVADLNRLSTILNYMCDQLWLRDQVLAGKVTPAAPGTVGLWYCTMLQLQDRGGIVPLSISLDFYSNNWIWSIECFVYWQSIKWTWLPWLQGSYEHSSILHCICLTWRIH